MADIVPALLSEVRSAFQRNVEKNRTIQRVNNRIRDGTATTKDAHLYAEEIGEALSEAFRETLKPGVLPDDRMYYNIASRVVIPTMRHNFDLSQAKASEIEKLILENAGFGINPVKALFPKARVDGLIDKISEAETLQDILAWLEEPLVNTTISFYDDWLVSNLDLQRGLGMEPTIRRETEGFAIRTARGGKAKYMIPCKWCQGLAGEYEYGEQPADFFRRHEGCRCSITLDSPVSGYVREGGWGKMVWQASQEVLNNRKIAGL